MRSRPCGLEGSGDTTVGAQCFHVTKRLVASYLSRLCSLIYHVPSRASPFPSLCLQPSTSEPAPSQPASLRAFKPATLPHFHTATLPHCHTSTLPHFHTSTLPHFHVSTFPRFHTSTFPRFHVSTLPHFHASTLPHFHASTFPRFHASTFPRFHASTLSRFHVSTFPRFHVSTLPRFHVSTLAAMLTLCSTRGQLYGAGDTGRVTPELRSAIAAAARATAHNTTLRLSVALSYGARQDIVSAARLLATKAGDGRVWARFPGLKFGGLGLVANMTGIANFSQF